MAEIADHKTIWTYNVPESLRALVVAAFPGHEFRFVSIHRQLEADLWRIRKSASPALAIWGDGCPSDIWAVAAKAKLPIFQLYAAPLTIPDERSGDVQVPLGFGFESITEPPTGLLRSLPVSATGVLDRAACIPRDELAKLVEVYVQNGLTSHTYAPSQLAPMPASSDGAPRVVVIADPGSAFHTAACAPDVSIGSLLQKARRENPNGHLVMVLNTDPAVSGRAQSEVGQMSLALADEVVAGYYHPSTLRPRDKVYVLSSLAGLDAMLFGLDVICAGEPLYRLGLGPSVPDTVQHDIFAAYFLDGLNYVDPKLVKPIDLGGALDLVQAATEPARRMTFDMPAARGAAGRSLPLVALTSLPEASQPAVPVRAREMEKSKPEVIERARKEPNRFLVPDWLRLENPFIVIEGDQAVRDVVALTVDLESHLVALAMLDTGRQSSQRLRPRASVAREVMEEYAGRCPDVFQDTIRLWLHDFDPARCILLVGDIKNIAMRLVARVAREIGLPRLHVPATVYVTGEGISAGANPARSLLSLADYIVMWDASHGVFWREIGGSEDRIFEWMPPSKPEGARKNITVALQLVPASKYFGAETARLSEMVKTLAWVAEVFNADVSWIFSSSAAGIIQSSLISDLINGPSFAFSPVFDLELAMRSKTTATDLLISDVGSLCNLAQALCVKHINAIKTSVADIGDISSDDNVSFSQLIMNKLDQAEPQVQHGLIWNQIISTKVDFTCLPSAGERVFMQQSLPVTLFGSNAPREVFTQTQRYVLDMMGFESLVRAKGNFTKINKMADVDVFGFWGIRWSKTKSEAILLAKMLKRDIFVIEDGFLRSIQIGLSGEPALAILLDDLTAYYDATRPSRLETVLNSGVQLSDAELMRARRVMSSIQQTKVSKYNFAPYKRLMIGEAGRPKILLVDQRLGDQSVESGLAGPQSFTDMLDTAMSFSVTHDIIVKTHPDRNIGGKEGYFTDLTLEKYKAHTNLFLVEDDMNPYSLIDMCEKVFVVTSGMGFEALIAGKEVWCFGIPFYANWGVTKDAKSVARRKTRRSVAEIFHFSYIKASRYYSPSKQSPCQIEDVIGYLVDHRPFNVDSRDVAANTSWGIRKEWAKFSGSPANQYVNVFYNEPKTSKSLTLAVGFSRWKQKFISYYFADKNFLFLDERYGIEAAKEIFDEETKLDVLVWGYKTIVGLSALIKLRNLSFRRIEDGFLRSVGLGAEFHWPHSLCIDESGMYFDARSPSDLESILANYNFQRDRRLMAAARSALAILKTSGLSKYNFVSEIDPREVYGPKRQKRVLVIGQVEDDASILFGAPPGSTNNGLVRLARAENPDAQVIYKIHPDVLARLRPELSDPSEVQDICQIVGTRMPMVDALHEVDHVYTLTSLAGFEALMRDIKVTTVGAPFYSGWGLTDERMPVERRTRKLTLDEVFAAAYILYPNYYDPATGQPSQIEETILRLQEELRAAEAKTKTAA